jgi:hypothetical protein
METRRAAQQHRAATSKTSGTEVASGRGARARFNFGVLLCEGVKTIERIRPVWITPGAVATTFALAQPFATLSEIRRGSALVHVAASSPATVTL